MTETIIVKLLYRATIHRQIIAWINFLLTIQMFSKSLDKLVPNSYLNFQSGLKSEGIVFENFYLLNSHATLEDLFQEFVWNTFKLLFLKRLEEQND